MDDPWGSNAWSTSSRDDQDISQRSTVTGWNTFERDADEETADVAAPTWNEVVEPIWDGSANLWNASSSTLDVWKPPTSPEKKSDKGGEDGKSEVSEENTAVSAGNALQDMVRISTPRPILPTPPLSPLPTPIIRSPSLPAEELIPPEVQLTSPDPFGSFESAETAGEELLDGSHDTWSPKTTNFFPEVTEPWRSTWDTEAQNESTQGDTDEWELAQEAKRKRDQKVPPELLSSLLSQWETIADEIYGKMQSESEDSFSWRKGLDNVENLSELMEKLLPPASFPLPVPLSKSRLSKSVKDALRLTRSFAMTQSSPMARLYASKGSTEWERAVQSQNALAQDNWGWDLKYELEGEKGKEKIDEKDKRNTGFLSFWGRKSSTSPSSPPVSQIKSFSSTSKPPTAVSPIKPSSPLASTRASVDVSSRASSDVPVQQEIISMSIPTITDSTTTPTETPSPQPSAMSRLWSKLSKRASTPLNISDDKGKDKHSSLQEVSLSADELSFLSDVPSGISSKSQTTTDSIEAILTMPSKATSSKLPPPLAPPPPSSFVRVSQNSAGNHHSVDSFEGQMIHTQLTDLLDGASLDNVGGKGYAPVLFDPLESPKKNEPTLRSSPFPLGPVPSLPVTMSSPLPFPSAFQSTHSPPLPLPQPPVRNMTGTSTINVSSELWSLSPSPAILPPVGPSEHSLPTPMKASDSLDQFSNFISGSSLNQPAQTSSPPSGEPAKGLTGSFVAAPAELDIGDFGEFISTSPFPTEPSKLLRSIDPTSSVSLAQSASGRAGGMAGSTSGAASSAGQLSAGTSSSPRIAPPPGFNAMVAGRPKTINFLDDDVSTFDLSVPVSGAKPFFPLSSTRSQSSTPTISLSPMTTQSGESIGQSGLSAQDLSFFEGL